MTTDRRLYDMDLGRRDHARWLGSNRYAGGAPLTLPTTNLLAAYDARVGVTNVAGACSAWADQSGNGWHASQGMAGSRPTITTTGGFASLQFDGTADFLNVPSITASAGTKTIYAVISPTWDASIRIIMDIQTGRMLSGVNTSKYQAFDGSWRDTGVTAASGLQRVTYEAATGALSFWKGGTPATPAAWTSGPAVGGSVLIGAAFNGGGSLFFQGHILFLAIYTAARNTAVESYITQEWGV